MPAFEISLLTDIDASGSVEVGAQTADEAVRVGLSMHQQSLVEWYHRGQSIGPFNGSVKRAWAVQSGPGRWTVSMTAGISIAATQVVTAEDRSTAEAVAESLNRLGRVPWDHKRTTISYADPSEEVWSLPGEEPAASVLDSPTTSTIVAVPASVPASDGSLVLLASVTSGRGVPTGSVDITISDGTTSVVFPSVALDSSGRASATHTGGWAPAGPVTVTLTYPGSGHFAASSASTSAAFTGVATSFLRSVDDSVDATDDASAAGTNNVFLADSASVAFDVAADEFSSATTSVSDSASASDSVALAVDWLRLPADSSSASDSASTATAYAKSPSDAVDVTDSATAQKVTFYSTVTTVTGPDTGNYGDQQTFTATVTSPGSGQTPQGTVQFYDNGSPVGSPVALNGLGAASLLFYPGAGARTISATYTPTDGVHLTSSGNKAFTGYYTTSTSVVLVGDPVQYGAPLTLRATVSSAYGTPTGTVDFYVSNAYVGSAALNAFGQADFSLGATDRNAGTYGIGAIHPLNGLWLQSGGTSTGSMTIAKADVTVTVDYTNPDPNDWGQGYSVFYTISTSTGVPFTGTSRFFVNAGLWSTYGEVNSNGGSFSVGGTDISTIGNHAWTADTVSGTNFNAAPLSSATNHTQTKQDSYTGTPNCEDPDTSAIVGDNANNPAFAGLDYRFIGGIAYERGIVETGFADVWATGPGGSHYIGQIPVSDMGGGNGEYNGVLTVPSMGGTGQYNLEVFFLGAAHTYYNGEAGTGNGSTGGSLTPWYVSA